MADKTLQEVIAFQTARLIAQEPHAFQGVHQNETHDVFIGDEVDGLSISVWSKFLHDQIVYEIDLHQSGTTTYRMDLIDGKPNTNWDETKLTDSQALQFIINYERKITPI